MHQRTLGRDAAETLSADFCILDFGLLEVESALLSVSEGNGPTDLRLTPR